jgi:two-component sensor histidine kinase
MNFKFKRYWKLLLLFFAVNIAILSWLYTNQLANKLAKEESKKAATWTAAMQRLAQAESDEDVGFLLDIIRSNETIPIILADDSDNVLNFSNIDTNAVKDKEALLKRTLAKMKTENVPIEVEYMEGHKNYVYFKNSVLLSQLKWYPFLSLGLVALFIGISYFAFSSSRRYEQNQVWVGLAKETAHQLGTPISSLIAWVDLFKAIDSKPDTEMLNEMRKDITRLELVTERFSKIGSDPVLVMEDIPELVSESVAYLKARASQKVVFEIKFEALHSCYAKVNRHLFDWVIENLTKNAIDAMDGRGEITFSLTENKKYVVLDVRDSGKGISSSDWQQVFKPGYTTKKRGWGLGLSLAKRIVEEYHKGHIFVKDSNPEKGTTFRIILKK